MNVDPKKPKKAPRQRKAAPILYANSIVGNVEVSPSPRPDWDTREPQPMKEMPEHDAKRKELCELTQKMAHLMLDCGLSSFKVPLVLGMELSVAITGIAVEAIDKALAQDNQP